ncbi:hypothetical protein MJO29_010570 [Puccinia striiformis f. sp. tritici]|nr:hypothetical protein MJO29_010570 [Puccinia striiformis f. sp. tritici]
MSRPDHTVNIMTIFTTKGGTKQMDPIKLSGLQKLLHLRNSCLDQIIQPIRPIYSSHSVVGYMSKLMDSIDMSDLLRLLLGPFHRANTLANFNEPASEGGGIQV